MVLRLSAEQGFRTLRRVKLDVCFGARFLAFSPLFTLSRSSFSQIKGSLVLLEFSIVRRLETISPGLSPERKRVQVTA